MIQNQTLLVINDNSGAKILKCIKILGGSHKKVAQIGDIIVGSIQKAIPNRKVKKGEVHKALIIGTKKPYQRANNNFIKFDNNCAVLINSQGMPLGTRIFGPVTSEIRKKKFLKICSLAEKIL